MLAKARVLLLGKRGDPPADDALVARARTGDQDAFRELYERHAPAVLGLVRHIVRDAASADEALEDAFVRAYGALGAFDLERPFGPWIAEIARNAARDKLRARSSTPTSSPEEPLSAVDPLEVVAQREREAVLLEALVELPEKERAVVVCRYRKGLTQVETATELKCSRRTVAELQKRALVAIARIVRLRMGKKPETRGETK